MGKYKIIYFNENVFFSGNKKNISILKEAMQAARVNFPTYRELEDRMTSSRSSYIELFSWKAVHYYVSFGNAHGVFHTKEDPYRALLGTSCDIYSRQGHMLREWKRYASVSIRDTLDQSKLCPEHLYRTAYEMLIYQMML